MIPYTFQQMHAMSWFQAHSEGRFFASYLLGCSVWNFVKTNGLPVGPTSLFYVCLRFAATFRLLQIFSFLSILLACLFLLKRWDCKIILFLCSLLPTDMASQCLLGSTSLTEYFLCVHFSWILGTCNKRRGFKARFRSSVVVPLPCRVTDTPFSSTQPPADTLFSSP